MTSLSGLVSSEIEEILLPISFRSWMADTLKTPRVSTAIGYCVAVIIIIIIIANCIMYHIETDNLTESQKLSNIILYEFVWYKVAKKNRPFIFCTEIIKYAYNF